MNPDFQRYRFARIKGQNITRARLETQFRNGITDLDELESAIVKQLTAEPTNCAPWRRTEVEQTGCREGIRMRLSSSTGHSDKSYDVQVGIIPIRTDPTAYPQKRNYFEGPAWWVPAVSKRPWNSLHLTGVLSQVLPLGAAMHDRPSSPSSSELSRAAQYLRMSTEHQQY
jgi:hypothetical protein